ncbi:tRNA1(Val) (adenine(37)-N6)-methyltransferase [Sinomicrobium soli]|uniref:tRNA1(Val) (adenine(37)-N6)-methyltransferase n=1 Tax=Sinomicrobium sp. N-1-3-6 TaxID=2219864 RepID=UPI001F003B9A|nr:methyltransferase [Sinomicrobium sp. N-1-3-6]
MKVGTDGVLLGAWADVSHHPFSVLDIGAGTGVIALMTAQRCGAELIDAVEIDGAAYEQCVENFENSPWNDRLFCYHASLADFAGEMDDTYELIVSNPPFFSEHTSSSDPGREKARSAAWLPFEQLLEAVARLLADDGRFNVVIPYREEERFLALAAGQRLYPYRITRVRGREGAGEHGIGRSLVGLSFRERTLRTDMLAIERERHDYTEAYRALTGDFYLNM